MHPIQLFKCLSDETRLKILLLIQSEQELCVCELTSALEVIQPKISRHLAQLRKHGLLLDRKQKQWVYYRINPALATWVQDLVMNVSSANATLIADDMQRLQQMGERPERLKLCCN